MGVLSVESEGASNRYRRPVRSSEQECRNLSAVPPSESLCKYSELNRIRLRRIERSAQFGTQEDLPMVVDADGFADESTSGERCVS